MSKITISIHIPCAMCIYKMLNTLVLISPKYYLNIRNPLFCKTSSNFLRRFQIIIKWHCGNYLTMIKKEYLNAFNLYLNMILKTFTFCTTLERY